MTTPHHFTYLSNSEEIQILHKSVDLAEKDFDRGRIQVNTKYLVTTFVPGIFPDKIPRQTIFKGKRYIGCSKINHDFRLESD